MIDISKNILEKPARLAARDDEPAMRARKQFTPAQRAIVAEWHKRELAMLAQERA